MLAIPAGNGIDTYTHTHKKGRKEGRKRKRERKEIVFELREKKETLPFR